MTARFKATSEGHFHGDDISCRCALGKGGIVAAEDKSEGDGASPLGIWEMRRVFWRPDRMEKPETGLPAVPLTLHDGWCDAPEDPLYNCPVQLPYPASCEHLWRDDHIYDIIVELDHNRDPVTPGAGSAIFFHLARENYAGTEGCIAISLDDMKHVLSTCEPGSTLEIAP
ncbi:L,D-transpeptidase family protein [Henriciella sp.]|uniref:L,D-transpeptidase family protein n=1 Tax=Henriciella sp. TaxID=1968823 RepID=UPI002635C311|nr:L,D-transpeptidase family protein [Henriciella sp.]